MQRIKFTERIVINCSSELAFYYSQDYKNRLKWDAFLKQADLMQGATEAGMGVKAYCVARNGLGMVTEYVSFKPPIAAAIKMTKGPWIFKSFLGSWNFKTLDQHTTEVTFLYSFQLRFPFLLFARLIKKNLQANVRTRLTDLKTKIENITAET